MIPSRKSALFTWWFARHAERRLHKAFGSIQVKGLAEVVRTARDAPVLVVSNHTAWWDPLLILWLSARVLRLDAYAMMDAKNLRRLTFFARVGAFGVDLDDPRDGARAIRYASKLLTSSGQLVWMFPQGREVPTTARPLAFERGSAEIARVAKCVVVPAAIRYEHGSAPLPTVYVAFGKPLAFDRDVIRGAATQEKAVLDELDALDSDIIEGRSLEELYRARPGALFSLAQWALSLVSRLPPSSTGSSSRRLRGTRRPPEVSR